MPTIVRPLDVADRPAWEELWAQYNAFYGRAGTTALAASVVQTTWSRLLDREEPAVGLVAERAGALVGLCHVVFHRNLIRIADTCYLQDLFTSPEARGEGIARSMIDSVVDLCRTRGVADIYWHTHASNDPARRLYDRIAADTGFVVYRKFFD
jgi:GNAT superfamily N-acetyltransferase